MFVPRQNTAYFHPFRRTSTPFCENGKANGSVVLEGRRIVMAIVFTYCIFRRWIIDLYWSCGFGSGLREPHYAFCERCTVFIIHARGVFHFRRKVSGMKKCIGGVLPSRLIDG